MARIGSAHTKRVVGNIIFALNRNAQPRIPVWIRRVNIQPAIDGFAQNADFSLACQIIHFVKIAWRQPAAKRTGVFRNRNGSKKDCGKI